MRKPVANLTSDSRFREIWRELNHNQRRFVIHMPECQSKKECATDIGLDPRSVYNWPDIVDEAIELFTLNTVEAARETLRDAVAKAVIIKVNALDSDDESIRQRASTEIQDRVLGKATQFIESEGGFDVNLPGVGEMLKKVYGDEGA